MSDWNITAKSGIDHVKRNLDEYNSEYQVSDHFGKLNGGKGAFTSKDSSIRKTGCGRYQGAGWTLLQLGENLISLWPGQDGLRLLFPGRLYP